MTCDQEQSPALILRILRAMSSAIISLFLLLDALVASLAFFTGHFLELIYTKPESFRIRVRSLSHHSSL